MSQLRPHFLSIAASDSLGIAGITQDTAVAKAMGVHAQLCVSANTLQGEAASINPINQSIFEACLNEAFRDEQCQVIKSGVLASVEQVNFLAEQLAKHKRSFVADPVFFASSSLQFLSQEGIESFKRELLPQCTVVTPNIQEAELLSGIAIKSVDDLEQAAKAIVAAGAKSVVIKGGHAAEIFCEHKDKSIDYFYSEERHFYIANTLINTKNSRATGCTFASALASALSLDYSLYDAVVIARMAVNQALRNAYGLSDRQGPVNLVEFPDATVDLPKLYARFEDIQTSLKFAPPSLPKCTDNTSAQELGIYPVVDSSEWIEKLLGWGIKTIQLRIKNLTGEALFNEIKKSVKLSEQYNARLFINDYWPLAIEAGAYGVHLGQEDIEEADLKQIQDAGLRLGLSTHCHYELARAWSVQPSYIACGPTFETTTKIMPWKTHGMDGVDYWRKVLGDHPMVTIGGIKQEHIAEIAAKGVNGIAMITAITLANNPKAVVDDMCASMQKDFYRSSV